MIWLFINNDTYDCSSFDTKLKLNLKCNKFGNVNVTIQNGIFSDAMIENLILSGNIKLSAPVAANQVQPASLDLRLGARVWRMRASFLPGSGRSVMSRIEALSLHEMDLTKGAVLETGCVYIAELMESMALPAHIAASANPKSSTGRLDVFTRVIANEGTEFDQIPAGYHGALYAEISPRTFPVLVRQGSRLSQIRFRTGAPRLNNDELQQLHNEQKLVSDVNASVTGGMAISVDLAGFDKQGLIGYRAKRHTGLVDMDKVAAHKTADFWEPLVADAHNALVLDPDQFYILASKESVHVPPNYAAEMTPFDPLVGEFRVHYAGFFDPGFGHSSVGGAGSRAVLEVRSHDVPFIIEDGQVVGRLVYERMAELPKTLYGQDLKSNYQAQGLKLSKHFIA
jgi:dCTP deaminase